MPSLVRYFGRYHHRARGAPAVDALSTCLGVVLPERLPLPMLSGHRQSVGKGKAR